MGQLQSAMTYSQSSFAQETALEVFNRFEWSTRMSKKRPWLSVESSEVLECELVDHRGTKDVFYWKVYPQRKKEERLTSWN